MPIAIYNENELETHPQVHHIPWFIWSRAFDCSVDEAELAYASLSTTPGTIYPPTAIALKRSISAQEIRAATVRERKSQ